MKIKRIELTVMDQQNKKVLRRFRVKPDRGPHTYSRVWFTFEGAEKALEQLIEQIDANNPNHRYRLVDLGRYRFKLVWDAEVKTPSERSESD